MTIEKYEDITGKKFNKSAKLSKLLAMDADQQIDFSPERFSNGFRDAAL